MRVDGRTACREGGRTLGGRGDDQKQRMDEVEDGFFQEVYSRSSFFCSALHRVVDRARQTFAWKVTKGGATNNQVGLQQSARCGQTLLYAEVSQELDTIQDPPQATLGEDGHQYSSFYSKPHLCTAAFSWTQPQLLLPFMPLSHVPKQAQPSRGSSLPGSSNAWVASLR